MVSLRCKMLVKAELEKIGAEPIQIELGWAEIKDALTDKQKVILKNNLFNSSCFDCSTDFFNNQIHTFNTVIICWDSKINFKTRLNFL